MKEKDKKLFNKFMKKYIDNVCYEVISHHDSKHDVIMTTIKPQIKQLLTELVSNPIECKYYTYSAIEGFTPYNMEFSSSEIEDIIIEYGDHLKDRKLNRLKYSIIESKEKVFEFYYNGESMGRYTRIKAIEECKKYHQDKYLFINENSISVTKLNEETEE